MLVPDLTFFCELDGESLSRLFSNPLIITTLSELNACVSLGIIDLLPERAEVVRTLNRAKIPVIAWQLLPQEQGYWYNMCNSQQAFACYAAFKGWSEKNDLHWSGIGIDIEPDIHEFQDLLLNKKRLLGSILRRGCGKKRLQQAQSEYRRLICQMKEDGFTVDSYEFPFMIDEYSAGSKIIRRLTGIVKIPADRQVVMLYTSFFRPYGQAVLWNYAKDARTVAIGITGGGIKMDGIKQPPPLTWAEFSRDLQLAYQRTKDIHIFSLEGCIDQGFLPRLVNFDWGRSARPAHPWNELVMLLRMLMRMALWASAHPLAVVILLLLSLWLWYQI